MENNFQVNKLKDVLGKKYNKGYLYKKIWENHY